MIRRDVLTRWRDSGKADGNGDLHIELSAADHEEPTWELRRQGGGRRRLDGRTRSILIVAAVAALVVNAGAAWAYWHFTGSKTGRVAAGTEVEMVLRARSDLNRPLRPGQGSNLTVTVTNDNEFPIRITAVTPGEDPIVADDVHRDEGCLVTGVRLNRARFDVSWEVPRNTIGAFTISDALSMRADANPACVGAVFTVPVRASGVSRAES